MNKSYKVIWSKVRNCYVVVSELAKRHSKAPSVSSVKGVVASVTAAAALSVVLGGYGVAWAETVNENTFKNFANGDLLKDKANSWLDDNEFNNSTGLYSINAHSAYQLGYSGQGVALGLLDSGVRDEHQEFSGAKIAYSSLATGWNWSENDHGSHVAGIMAAKKDGNGMQGVAYNSTIESVGADDSNKMSSYVANSNQLTAKIINNSWSLTGNVQQNYINTLINEVTNQDKVFVFTAGNDGKLLQKNTLIGTLANKQELKNNVLNVISLDPATDSISYFSGIAKDVEGITVSAYGGGIKDIKSVNAATVDGYKDLNGTSMAAPYVSGGLGLVKEALPYLNGKQLVDSVLTTANSNIKKNKLEITVESKVENGSRIATNFNIIYVDKNQQSLNNVKNDFKEWLNTGENWKTLIDDKSGIINLIGNKLHENYKNYNTCEGALNNIENEKEKEKVDACYVQLKALTNIINNTSNIGSANSTELLSKIEDLKKRFDENNELVQGTRKSFLSSYSDLLNEVKPLIINETVEYIITEKKNYKTVYKTFKEVYGAGLLDVGKAVQGIGAIDVDRLSDEDKTNQYSNSTNYVYKVNTGKPENNYNKRDYSIWSNDIGEKNTSGMHAGLLKSGDVDLVLLGENSYQGPTIVTGGHLQIVRGVEGDVYAGSSSGATVEINGKAKNIYALRNGNIEEPGVVITDTVTQKDSKATDADFYNSALPKTNTVNIEGGLFAIGKDLISEKGSVIKVNLQEADSQIKGALYQDELSQINLDLSNKAKLIVEQGTGYYDGSSYIGNNTINDLSLNSKATVDLKTDKSFQTLTVNHLYGSQGIFALNTDIKNNQGDKLVVKDAPLNSIPNLQIWDENLGIEKQTTPLLVATAPSSVIFSGYPADSGVYQYYPIIDRTISAGTAEWFFSGYDTSANAEMPYITWIDKYTTKDKIDKPIAATTNRIVDVEKVDGGEAFQVNAPNERNSAAIIGNVIFQNKGPVKVNLKNIDHVIGIDSRKGNFKAEQPIMIESNTSSDRGFYLNAIENKQNSIFENNLTIKLDCSGSGAYDQTRAIVNEGNLEVHGDTDIYFDGGLGSAFYENYGVYNTGTLKFNGENVNIEGRLGKSNDSIIYNDHKGILTIDSGDVVVKGTGQAIYNSGKLDVSGKNITISSSCDTLTNWGDMQLRGDNIKIENSRDIASHYSHYVFFNNGNLNIDAKSVNFKGINENENYNSGKMIINADEVVFGTSVFHNQGSISVNSDFLQSNSLVNGWDIEVTSLKSVFGNLYTYDEGNSYFVGDVEVKGEFGNTRNFTVSGVLDASNSRGISTSGILEAGSVKAQFAEINNEGTIRVKNDVDGRFFYNNGTIIAGGRVGASSLENKGKIQANVVNGWNLTNSSEIVAAESLQAGTINNSGSLQAPIITNSYSFNNAGQINSGSLYSEGNVDNKNGVISVSGAIEIDKKLTNSAGKIVADKIRLTGKREDYDETAGSILLYNMGDIEAKDITVTSNKYKDNLSDGPTIVTDFYESAVINEGELTANTITVENGEFKTKESSITKVDKLSVGRDIILEGGTVELVNLEAPYLSVSNNSTLKADNEINIKNDYVDRYVFVGNELINKGKKHGNVAVEVKGSLTAKTLSTKNGDLISYDSSSINVNAINVDGTANFKSGEIKTDLLKANSLEVGKEAIISVSGDTYLKNTVAEDNNTPWLDSAINSKGKYNINAAGKGTVQIIGGVSGGVANDGDVAINLSNSESYITGVFDGATVRVSDGAMIEVAPYRKNVRQTIDLLDLSSQGLVTLYTNKSRSGIADVFKGAYINNDTTGDLLIKNMRGTGGVFQLGIYKHDEYDDLIRSQKVIVDKNLTENAKHIIRLTPMQTDFMLSNDKAIKQPFTVMLDKSEFNGGYALNFDIEKFDAGVYNYTPTLTKEKVENGDLLTEKGNYWKVTDIKVTGSSAPEDPVKPDEPVDPKPDDPTPDDPTPVVEPVDSLLTVDTTKLTDADKTNNYGSDTVYLQKVDTGSTLDTDSIVTNDVKEVTGSDKLHGGIVAEGKNDLVLSGDNTYQGPTVSRLQDGATLQVVKGVQGDAVAEDGGSLALHGDAKGVYAAANSDVLITDTVARKVINASDSKEQKEAKEKFNASVPEKTTVNVTGGVFATDGNVKVDLSNSESVVRGPLYTGANGSTDITLDNGAKVIAEKGSGKYKGMDFAGNNKVTRLNINNGSVIDISGDGEISELHVETLNGTGGVFGLDIHQEAKDSGNITADKIIIDKNETKGASHTIQFTPDQADFLLSKGTKVNAFDVAEDHSEPNGGYAVEFAATNFDAGVYNYTPTIGSEKDGGNVNRWKVTDIRITGSEPEPTPTPGPTPTPSPTPTPVPTPTPKPVLSNLTYNTQAAAINNYYRWRDEYNNLEKRLGDLRYSNEENGIWARTFHGREDSGKYGLNSNYTAFQIGYDRKVETKNGGKWFIGGAVTSYDGKTSFDHLGRTENKSVGLALYGSYLGSKGHYVDIVARHSRLNTELDSYATGTGAKVSGDYHNWGSSIGVEYGRRIALKKGYFVQPQAELVYGHLNSVNYNLDDGSHVSQSGVSTWTARGGVMIGRQMKKGNIYASIGILHDFGDDSRFAISDKYGGSYSSSTNPKDTWWEMSIGGNAQLSKSTYMYADVEKTFSGDVRTKWRYNLGVRHSF